MEQFLNIFSNLDVRFCSHLPSTSSNCTPTAVYQFVTRDTTQFRIQVDGNCRPRFEALYKHDGKFYPHPYTLKTIFNGVVNTIVAGEHYPKMMCDISLYLELKRLRDFQIDDSRRYYQTIDKNIDANQEIYDFHDVYLNMYYINNGHTFLHYCNNSAPIHLPKLISNPWTSQNTVTRFRYNAENRDGTFFCEMTLRHGNSINLPWYKIVLCLTSNTIPARMDYHSIRWTCKLKPKVSRQNGSARCVEKEKTYCLSHDSGIIIAHVCGPELKFTPHALCPINNSNYVRSCYEPEDFRIQLQNSDYKDNSTLAIVVTKETDYPERMKERRKNKDILPYLPCNELEDVNSNLETSNDRIIKHLKVHKDQCVKQLVLSDENERETFSQAHVRLYVAAYNEHDVLLTETLHPPLRNNKAFEALRVIRMVQPDLHLQANKPAYVYCVYDHSKCKSDRELCPFQFELVFIDSSNVPNEEQLLQLFNTPHICVNAFYVPNCPDLLEFKIPNVPEFDEHRVFIRLRHTRTKDYYPSAVALNDKECWIYHADPISVTDCNASQRFSDLLNADPMNSYLDLGLQITSTTDNHLSHNNLTYDSEEDSGSLNTPDLDSRKSPFFNPPSSQNNH